MSKIIATGAIRGAHTLVKQSDELLQKVIASKGEGFVFEFPDTAYYLPMIKARSRANR